MLTVADEIYEFVLIDPSVSNSYYEIWRWFKRPILLEEQSINELEVRLAAIEKSLLSDVDPNDWASHKWATSFSPLVADHAAAFHSFSGSKHKETAIESIQKQKPRWELADYNRPLFFPS